MNNNNKIIDEGSIRDYVRDYTIFPNLRESVQRAQDENPEIRALALSPINVERTIEQLREREIITIGTLDNVLNVHKAEILQLMNQLDSASIAARHVYTPIYILLENISNEL